MRSYGSRRQDYRLAAGVGFCLGVYVVLAVAFHWLMQPTVSENYGVAAYKPPPATIVVYPKAPFVPPPPSELPSSSIAEEPPASTAFAAAPAEVLKQVPKKHVARTAPRRERPARERRNPWDYAWGPSYGYRPWY